MMLRSGRMTDVISTHQAAMAAGRDLSWLQSFINGASKSRTFVDLWVNRDCTPFFCWLPTLTSVRISIYLHYEALEQPISCEYTWKGRAAAAARQRIGQ